MERIVFADRCFMTNDSMQTLESLGEIMKCENAEELRERAREATIILSEYTPVTREIILSAPALKAIIAVGAGYNHIDIEAATREAYSWPMQREPTPKRSPN